MAVRAAVAMVAAAREVVVAGEGLASTLGLDRALARRWSLGRSHPP